MLVDQAIIQIRSGKGGDGHVGYRREKYIPKGGPNGGDGGNGGAVILEASPEVDTLLDFSGQHHWFAPNGEPGSRKQKHGKDGPDLIIRIPPGTLVYDGDTGELLVDLAELGERFEVAKGGRGGFGNEHFKSATVQTPDFATPGEPGEERMLRLELKLIADVGLVGKPNAGKSTLLSRITAARPKVGAYPFTTLEPNLGICELSSGGGAGSGNAARRLVVADIPGLIEGASEGAGLGHDFLRHIERTRLLVHLIELEPADDGDPIHNYRAIRRELDRYSQTLAAKPELIAVSKADLLGGDDGSDALAAAALVEAELNRPVFVISAATGWGIDALLEACWAHLLPERQSAKTPDVDSADAVPGEDRPRGWGAR